MADALAKQGVNRGVPFIAFTMFFIYLFCSGFLALLLWGIRLLYLVFLLSL